MPLGMEVGLSPGDFVFDGDPAPPSPKKGHSPHQFPAHVYCGLLRTMLLIAFTDLTLLVGLLDNSRIANSRTGRLVDWSTRGLDKSWTGQLADAIGHFACLVFRFLAIRETASCPVRNFPVHELAYPRVVQ